MIAQLKLEFANTNDDVNDKFHEVVVGSNYSDVYLPPHLILRSNANSISKKYEISCEETKVNSTTKTETKTQCCTCF